MNEGHGRPGRIGARRSVRRAARPYAAELTIACLGALAGAAEAVLADNSDIALLVVLISWFLALAVAVIRQDLSNEMRAGSAEARLLDAIPDDRWRHEASAELDRQRAEFASWAAGTRTVAEPSSINYQIDVVRTADRSVSAVHVALDDDSLGMWADPQRGFDGLVDAYRGLPDSVRCRRVLILDESSRLCVEDAGRRLIVDPGAQEVCRTQIRDRRSGGLGFELRVHWVKTSDRRRPHLLIVDGREACTIEGHGKGRFGDLVVSVNDAVVQAHVRSFEDLWTASVPVEWALPSPGAGQPVTP